MQFNKTYGVFKATPPAGRVGLSYLRRSFSKFSLLRTSLNSKYNFETYCEYWFYVEESLNMFSGPRCPLDLGQMVLRVLKHINVDHAKKTMFDLWTNFFYALEWVFRIFLSLQTSGSDE